MPAPTTEGAESSSSEISDSDIDQQADLKFTHKKTGRLGDIIFRLSITGTFSQR